jgi:hypothetical protein
MHNIFFHFFRCSSVSFIPIFAATKKERQIMRTVQFREAICEAMSASKDEALSYYKSQSNQALPIIL